MRPEERHAEKLSRLVMAKSPGEFQIHAGRERFTKCMSGRAVRQRPLCLVAMFVECAAMAVGMTNGGLSNETIFFANLSFQAALGFDLAREVNLTLEKVKARALGTLS